MTTGMLVRRILAAGGAARLGALVAFGAAALVASGRPAQAAPRQGDFEIQAVAMVDLFGGDNADCPGCDGVYSPEDEQAALDPATALPGMRFVVKNGQGTEVTSDNTTSIGGLQSALLVVPALNQGESYTLELSVPPAGWLLCSQDSANRTLTIDNFDQGSARAEYHFTLACDAATPTPTDPAVPTPSAGTDVAPKPTAKPSGGGKPAVRLGAVKGLVFQDLNGDGKLGPDEPGLNDVRVMLRGGANLSQITKSTGTFSFEALGTGDYDVLIEPGPEWTVTTPSSYHVHVDGKDVIGNDFGLTRGKAKAAAAMPRLPKTGLGDSPSALLLFGAALALLILGTGGRLAERRSS